MRQLLQLPLLLRGDVSEQGGEAPRPPGRHRNREPLFHRREVGFKAFGLAGQHHPGIERQVGRLGGGVGDIAGLVQYRRCRQAQDRFIGRIDRA